MSTDINIIRSATFEGMADAKGFPTDSYLRYYTMLSRHVQTIITGFMYVSPQGKAMHPGQAGMDLAEKAASFRPVTEAVHSNGGKILAQLAHVGRQTNIPGAAGVSGRKSPYFGVTPRVLTEAEIESTVRDFAQSAVYAKDAGFDGIQLHCAHGYLIHQFLLASINDRQDAYKDRYLFLEQAVTAIRRSCGADYPLWVKISADVDIEPYSEQEYLALIQKLNALKVDAIEVSRGTMDVALNIFRGQIPIKAAFKHNPIYSSKTPLQKLICLPAERMKIKGFRPCYNLPYAKLAQKHTDIPIICVGGFRNLKQIRESGLKNISLCRPFICEPNLLDKWEADPEYISKCINCNICAVMVDTDRPLQCYRRMKL